MTATYSLPIDFSEWVITLLWFVPTYWLAVYVLDRLTESIFLHSMTTTKKHIMMVTAFQTQSLIQFIAWLPVVAGLVEMPKTVFLYGILLPHQSSDVLILWWFKRSHFTDRYRGFIQGHHTISCITIHGLMGLVGFASGMGEAGFQTFVMLTVGYYDARFSFWHQLLLMNCG